MDAERVARLAVQRQAAFTRAIETLFEWSKLCHEVAISPQKKLASDPRTAKLNEREAADVAQLRLLASSRVAESFSRAWVHYRRSTDFLDTISRNATIDAARENRRLFVVYAKADLGVESTDPNEDDFRFEHAD